MPSGIITTHEPLEAPLIALQNAREDAILYGYHRPRFDGPMDTRDVLGDDRLLLPQSSKE